MERKDFLKGMGALGLGALVPLDKAEARTKSPLGTMGNCALIPTETAGPFPLDLSANATYFRNDVRETKTGVQLDLKLKVLGLDNCEAMPNLRVNIWHCDKDGLYSGYSQANNPGQAGQTYLRGYQMTDSNGEVDFTTIFPGWYSGRVCHIHFQVYVSSVYAAISQLTFDADTKNGIYAANTSLYTKGADPMTISSDNIFSDGYAYQLASLTPNAVTGGYDAYLEVTIQGSGTVTGLGALEPETGGQFVLKQNYPNPFSGQTIIPFSLANDAQVSLELYDLTGKKAATLNSGNLSAGAQKIRVDLAALGLPESNYVYQLHVTNSAGHFTQCKLMTVFKK